jgi:Zn-dependent peptidase ImmA (M78 family)
MITGVTPKDLRQLKIAGPKAWSGGGLSLPDGEFVIILHPDQTPERTNSTVMEEIAHRYLGHAPSSIITESSGLSRRIFDEQTEREAYWTAAAALLPANSLARAIWRRETVESVAKRFGVSVELVCFRIKIMGLWKDYVAHAAYS